MSSVGRDQKAAKDAREEFARVAREFPDSIYAKDSVKKLKMIDNILAAHIMLVGRYYQDNGNAQAAIARYNSVITRLSDTAYTEEACYRVIECCLAIKLNEEANDAYELLKLRYPKGKWLNKANALMKKGFVSKK